jgi:hypothetical protein
MSFEVETPILNSPFAPLAEHWFLRPGHPPDRRSGRRPALEPHSSFLILDGTCKRPGPRSCSELD